MRLSLASFHGLLGERALFQREETEALAASARSDINPWQLGQLAGTHAHLGNAERALELLRRQLRDGRIWVGVGSNAPRLLDTPAFADFHRESAAERQRLRERYASAG